MSALSFVIGFVKGYAVVMAAFVLIALSVLAIHKPEHTPVPARVAQLERLHLAEVQPRRFPCPPRPFGNGRVAEGSGCAPAEYQSFAPAET
jgi:hypothetical protein